MKYSFVDIYWRQMFNYSELKHNSEAKKSYYVYIWIIKAENIYYPYYVGKTRNLPKRIIQHLAAIMGGTYNIYKMEQFKDFNLHKDHPLYCQIPSARIAQFIEDYLEQSNQTIHYHLREMVKNSYFTYAEISNSDAYDDIERSVIKNIGKNNLVNTMAGDPIKYKHRNHGDEFVLSILGRYSNE